MNIRSNPSECSQIVALLKKTLGESKIPKSEAIWNYKHRRNPFGISKILVAEIDEKIVGVRAFMRWTWQREIQRFAAFRAVDTATDPAFQRRGIFRKLTMQCLEELAHQPMAFVFNTPNEQSRRGNLSMGWQVIGRIPVHLSLRFFSPIGKTGKDSKQVDFASLAELCERCNAQFISTGQLFTPRSPDYLEWRYGENPLQTYKLANGDDWFVAVYAKQHKYFRELRVAEWLLETGSRASQREAAGFVRSLAKREQCHVISSARPIAGLPQVKLRVGPQLTTRNISVCQEDSVIRDLDAWNYQLGELELF